MKCLSATRITTWPLLATVLAACGVGLGSPSPRLPVEKPLEPALYASLPAGHTRYSHDSLAELFARLTLESEWGAARDVLVRYETPVAVRLEGPGASEHSRFVDRYLDYLRAHTGISIARTTARANLFVRFVPGDEFARVLPAASCVLVPEDRSWRDFASDPAQFGGDAMMEIEVIGATTVFVPATLSPADTRRCLVEEITQALGPQNDLYGLGPSIFNDDFGHVWPTRLDLLMLRVLYSDRLISGLSKVETRRRARAALAAMNPAGIGSPDIARLRFPGEAAWRAEIAKAHDSRAARGDRLLAADLALEQVEAAAPGSAWHCTSETVIAHLLKRADPRAALAHFRSAAAICNNVHGPADPRLAQIRLAMAGLLLSEARTPAALAALEGLEPVLAGHGQDEALAAYFTLKARAHRGVGQEALARKAAAQARAWSDYALGVGGAAFARLD